MMVIERLVISDEAYECLLEARTVEHTTIADIVERAILTYATRADVDEQDDECED